MYRCGYFYKTVDLKKWMAFIDCDDILDDEDCWLIYDGALPPEKPRCKILVFMSPGNLVNEITGLKAFTGATGFEVYFPTWTSMSTKLQVRKSITSLPRVSRRSRTALCSTEVFRDGFWNGIRQRLRQIPLAMTFLKRTFVRR